MKATENYGLKKPEITDFYNVEDFNGNMEVIDEKLKDVENHACDKENPHRVTKEQIGLENVDNTSDAQKNVKYAKNAGSATKAEQDANGNVIADTYAEKADLREAVDRAMVASTSSGKNPTLANSTHAPIIAFDGKGATIQDGEPTPDNPVDIHGVGESGSLEVKSTGKNLLPNLGVSRTVNGITFTVNDDKSVTVSGTATANAYFIINENFTIPAGTILSGCPSGGGDEKYSIHAWASNVDKRVDYGTGISFTNDYATKEIYIVIRSGATVSNLTFYPMIRLATETDATYEPYTETTANIPLSAPLYDDDYVRYNMDGSGEESHKMKAVVFDGSSDEVWGRNAKANGDNPYYFINVGTSGSIVANNVKCTHLTQASISTDNTINGINVINSSLGYARIIMRPSTDVCADESTFRAWLAEKKPKIVYELAQPTVTPLTAEQIAEFKKLQTFDGVTNITCDGETEISYFADSEGGRSIVSVVNKMEGMQISQNRISETANKAMSYATVKNGITSDYDYETGEVTGVGSNEMSANDAISHLDTVINKVIGGVNANKAIYETGTFNLAWKENSNYVLGYTYVKIGKLVIVSGTAHLDKALTASSKIEFVGLPFAVSVGSESYFYFGTNASHMPSNIATSNSIYVTGSTIDLRNVDSIQANQPMTLFGIYLTA